MDFILISNDAEDPLLGCATLPAGFGCLHGPPFFLLFFFSCTSPRHVLAAGGTPPSGLPTTTKHLSLPTYLLHTFPSVIFSVLLSRSLIPLIFRRCYSCLLLHLPPPIFLQPPSSIVTNARVRVTRPRSQVTGLGMGMGIPALATSYRRTICYV
ncbi:hypothetical protein HDV57DRAFT_297309 [Trichoderma longibrachiatum]|uniref:Uncharacterized protein n=1 Tax=Trichoderma longibrachiatum ATCC 18648 TaxID=983965 RepID=A0A2T4CCM2_TRILO|nr:hypothetical protein M440DRAFT_1166739 [Trichoderma longibrachiatum ATCC 18648]